MNVVCCSCDWRFKGYTTDEQKNTSITMASNDGQKKKNRLLAQVRQVFEDDSMRILLFFYKKNICCGPLLESPGPLPGKKGTKQQIKKKRLRSNCTKLTTSLVNVLLNFIS